MAFQTYTARLVRSTPLNDLTKHLDFEIQGAPRFGFVPRAVAFGQAHPA
jgi:hypothetical protein